MDRPVATNRQSSCPAPELITELSANFRRGLDADLDGALEVHLLSCDRCLGLFDVDDEPSDALLDALSILPGSADDELELVRLRERLHAAPVTLDDKVDLRAAMASQMHLADPKLEPLPTTLGNYELTACIGRGASGAVYRARHTKLEQIVAVKVLDADRFTAESSGRGGGIAQFFDEMKTIGQLDHPNIIRATDAGESGGLHFLVMEYVDGVDASRLLRTVGPLAIADACEVARQAAVGLQFAHERGLVHRDVKPSNLLVTVGGDVKLLDLGIAQSTAAANVGAGTDHAAGDTNRACGANVPKPIGTAAYMPPEQWTNSAAVDRRADIYSLGRTLLRLLTGKVPLPNTDQTSDVRSSLSLLRNSRPRPVPRALERLLERLLAANPADRPDSAAEVAAALLPLARGADLGLAVAKALPTTASLPFRSSSESPSGLSTLALPPALKTRRAAMVAVAAGACAGTFAFMRRSAWFAPQLQRDRLRLLHPVAPEVLISEEPRGDVQMHLDGETCVHIRSSRLALIQLGRPVVGTFSFQVDLEQENWPGDAGIFFQFRRASETEPAEYEFQTIELRPPDRSADPDERHLLWSGWRAVRAGAKWDVRRAPWAEALVNVDSARKVQRLAATLGIAGVPSLRWNGKSMHANQWKMSTEGRNRQRLSAEHLAHAFLGRLGLVNISGSNQFYHPRLAYL